MDLNKLLHPEELSEIELINVLKSLYVTIPPGLTKPEILKIFNKVALPLPQRTEITVSHKFSTEEILNLNTLQISNNNNYKRDNVSSSNLRHIKKAKLQQNSSFEMNEIFHIKRKFHNVQISDLNAVGIHSYSQKKSKYLKRPQIISQIEIADLKRRKLIEQMQIIPSNIE